MQQKAWCFWQQRSPQNVQSSLELSLEHPLNKWPEGRTAPSDCSVLVQKCACPANQQTRLKFHPTGSKPHLVSWLTRKCCASFWYFARCLWVDFPLKSIYPVQPEQPVFLQCHPTAYLSLVKKYFINNKRTHAHTSHIPPYTLRPFLPYSTVPFSFGSQAIPSSAPNSISFLLV